MLTRWEEVYIHYYMAAVMGLSLIKNPLFLALSLSQYHLISLSSLLDLVQYNTCYLCLRTASFITKITLVDGGGPGPIQAWGTIENPAQPGPNRLSLVGL